MERTFLEHWAALAANTDKLPLDASGDTARALAAQAFEAGIAFKRDRPTAQAA